MTAGLVFLYIIHGLKIMLALWASPQINFSKEKKEKKKALSTGGKGQAVKVFEKKVLQKILVNSRQSLMRKIDLIRNDKTLFYQNPEGLTFTDVVWWMVGLPPNFAIYFLFLQKGDFTFLFPLKKSNKRKLVAVFLSIHSTLEIVTNSVISVELPLGTHISIRFILSKNKATLGNASEI